LNTDQQLLFQRNSDLVRGLVSVVVPCFDVEMYIGKFIRSLISQTYDHLEIIFVNDGSTDSSREIIVGFIPYLQKRGFSVRLVDQENKGLAGAINAGLSFFTGEFLTWPDPDDWLTPDSIETRVEILREHPYVGLLRTNCEMIREEDNISIGFLIKSSHGRKFIDKFFWDVLLRRTPLAPISTFVKSACFLNVFPTRRIFETKKASQNIQMLLAISYKYQILQDDKVLGYYRVRQDSRSRSANTAELVLTRHQTAYKVTQETLKTIAGLDPCIPGLVKIHYACNIFLPLMINTGRYNEATELLSQAHLSNIRRLIATTLLTCHRVSVRLGGSGRVSSIIAISFCKFLKEDTSWEKRFSDE
jgi:hypothetical protein